MTQVTEDIKSIANVLANDIIIVFMGPTGSGKSKLIDTLTGQPGRRTGSSLASCTNKVCAVRVLNHRTYGDRLVLVEMPAFDNTEKSDFEILRSVSEWLESVYQKNIKLAGIVYTHRITDNSMVGSPHRHLSTFSKLCGDHAMTKVRLVTTMWDLVYSSTPGELQDKKEQEYEKREKILFENYWKKMMELGADAARSTNSSDSAWNIINTILKQQETEVLLLQQEIVDLKKAFNETEAGKTLYSDLQKLLAEQRDTVRSLAQQARDENNPQLARQLEAELKRIRKQFNRTFDEMKSLKIPIGKRLLQLFFGKKTRARSLRF